MNGNGASWFRRKPKPIVATGRAGRSIWDELNDQLPRPTDFQSSVADRNTPTEKEYDDE